VDGSFPGLEGIAERKDIAGAEMFQVVAAGVVQAPSGLEYRDGVIFVTDHATSTFHAFDTAGTSLRTLKTDLPPGSLSGFTFGPDGKVYFVDVIGGRVLRIDPRG
jgi:hypothetical protein